MTMAHVIAFPAAARPARPAPARRRRPRSAPAAVISLPARPASKDREQAVEILTNLRQRVIAGNVSGVMLVIRSATGEWSCANAGCIGAMQKDSLMPGLLGIINLCGAS